MTDDAERVARTQALWAGGDYAAVAVRLQDAAEVLVGAAGIQAGDRVLDAAAGTGNAAAVAQALGAQVVASDIAPAMVTAGRARTAGTAVEWVEADVQALPFEDAAFDATLSVFGAMFAPDAELTASELLRVTRPGGVVAMTAWVSEGSMALTNALIAREIPHAASAARDTWGDRVRVPALFGDGAEVTTERHALRWTFPDVEAWWAFTETGPPPIAAARRHIGEERWAALATEAVEAAREFAEEVPDGVVLEQPYLVILARHTG